MTEGHEIRSRNSSPMQRWRLAYPSGLFSQALSARVLSTAKMSRGLASGAADTASTSRKPEAPNHPSFPCQWPAPADRALVIAACFPTFPERLLPLWFSCNWNEWTDALFFYVRPEWHNLSPAATILTHAFKIRGTLRPLAFREASSATVLFAAGAEYFLWNGDALTLTRFGTDFALDEDFLARMTARGGVIDRLGAVEDLPLDYDRLYWRLDAEQRALAWEVDGRRPRDVDLLDPST
ncbi:hypothetical protein B0H10DRAFT_2043291 [Mycena sp. CBHHK59/15]|nr:hypothetical protein B0H10DRAFT_2043291 [Mycena sp. CBHHK59/15]